MRGFELNTLDLILTAIAYRGASSALHALRLIQARLAAGQLSTASAGIARLPVEIWLRIEAALINLGWSQAFDGWFAAKNVRGDCCADVRRRPIPAALNACGLASYEPALPACGLRNSGIDVCYGDSFEYWGHNELWCLQRHRKLRRFDGTPVDLDRPSTPSSPNTTSSSSNTTSAGSPTIPATTSGPRSSAFQHRPSTRVRPTPSSRSSRSIRRMSTRDPA